MANFPFDMQLVIDAVTLTTVANGQVYIYDANDTSNSTPLTLTDPNGLPLSQPLMSSNNAFIPAFVTTSPQVKWLGAGFSGFFDSYIGLRDEAIAARAAAEAAAGAAAGEVAEQLSVAVTLTAASAASATSSSAAAVAAELHAANAAAAASGGGIAVNPSDPDVMLISTRPDGSIAVDPTDADVLVLTT